MKIFGFDIQRRESAQTEEAQQPIGGSYASDSVQVSGQNSALGVSAWYCGLAVKAETFAQLVIEYQKKNSETRGGNYELYTRGEGRVINYLLQVQPNPLMTATQMMKQAAIQREVYGNAVIYVERDGYREVSALWLCSSATLDVTTMEYTITYNAPGGVKMLTVGAEDVIHWRNTYSDDYGLTGLGTLRYASRALSIAATNDKQALDIAAKGGKYKILLKEEQRPEFALNLLNKDQRTNERDNFQRALDEGRDVISYPGVLDVTTISQSAAEMNLLQSRGFDTQSMARYLRVPLVLLFDYTNNTYKAPEQAMQAFLQHTIGPMARDMESEMNAKLLGARAYPTLRFHANDNSLMRLDPKGRMEISKMQVESGIRSVNELRAQYDLPSLGAHGDRHLVSTNLQPLDDLKVGKNQSDKPADAPANEDKNEKGEEA